jgi:hypothetical protein
MQKKHLFGGALLVLMVAACGGPIDEGDLTTEEVGQDPGSSEDVAETSQALGPPGCVTIRRFWRGACLQGNWEVYNGCLGDYTVRVDIINFPDTSCRQIRHGSSLVLT